MPVDSEKHPHQAFISLPPCGARQQPNPLHGCSHGLSPNPTKQSRSDRSCRSELRHVGPVGGGGSSRAACDSTWLSGSTGHLEARKNRSTDPNIQLFFYASHFHVHLTGCRVNGGSYNVQLNLHFEAKSREMAHTLIPASEKASNTPTSSSVRCHCFFFFAPSSTHLDDSAPCGRVSEGEEDDDEEEKEQKEEEEEGEKEEEEEKDEEEGE
ncbi:unnamed protein product [Pleuronectes platessa]|uniref:Uncharacterized protein n=1 Tax=Pleuronectes platessa TaxID=8262 RepID=A0A9N7U813_PLEPL|nr:unnamed protein product [Pleuronectes platessa]